MAEVPVMHVRQKASGVESVINVSDFDPERHEAFEVEPEPAVEAVPEKPKRKHRKTEKSETVDVDNEADTEPEFVEA